MRPTTLFLISLLAIPASAQLPIPQRLLSEQLVAAPEIQPSSFDGRSSVAGNGETFLIATTQDGPLGFPQGRGVMLVDGEGRPMLEATHLAGGCGTIDVASDGSGYLAVSGCRGGTSGVRYDDETFQSVAIHADTRGALSPRDASGWRGVAWDGQQYVVLTTLETFDPRLFIKHAVVATRITSDGEILENDIDLGAGYASAIAARNGLTVAAIWLDGIVLRTVNTAGIVSPPRQLTDGRAGLVEIAAGDDGFLVVWNDPEGVHAQHLDASGNPDASPFGIGPGGGGGIAVTSEGAGFRVAWTDGEVVGSTFVLASGGAGPSEIAATGGRPALASNGASTLLVWQSISQQTRARRLDAEGEGWLVHRLRSQQRLEAFALNPAGPAVTWSEFKSDGAVSHLATGWQHLALPPLSRERFTFLRGLDRPLIIGIDGPPYSVRLADGTGEPFNVPSRTLFWTGDAILAVWSDRAPDTDPFAAMPLWAQRFRIDGHPLDPQPIRIGTSLDLNRGYSGPAALYNGVFAGSSADEVLIAYVDPNATLQGVILKDGTAIAIGEIAAPQALANPIEITSDGKDFLVTWISNRETIYSYIGSRRVLAGGAMPEPMRIQSTAGDRKDAMATFWTGENYLVVWSAMLPDHGRELWALRIARDGTLIDYPARRIGLFEGTAPQWAYSRGLLAMAYEREGYVYWRYVASGKRRATVR